MHITQLPLAEIDADALPRDRTTLDPGPLAELTRSIATSGLRQPVEVWRLHSPRPPHRYGLISGYRRLHAVRDLGHATIPAILRAPATLAEAAAAMVTENEIRAQISPWEKGRLILAAVEEGLADTPDAAVAVLYPVHTRQARARLRAFASVVEALDGCLATPERLSVARMERLAAALRAGWEDVIRTALPDPADRTLESQWAALAPTLAEALSPAGPEGPPGRTRRMLHLRQGLTIRREMTRTGWILRFSGPEARSPGLIDDVLDHVERWFQPAG